MQSIKQVLLAIVNWIIRFITDITSDIHKHAVKLVVGAVFVCLFLIFAPLWTEIQRTWANWHNITGEQALALSRKIIGAKVQFAIPFKNVGNPNQFIAAWVTKDAARPDPCIIAGDGVDAIGDEQDCPWGYGTAQAVLLIGNGEVYQEYPTKNYAFNITSPPPLVEGEFTPANYQKSFGVTDWNNDGKMEILSIAEDKSPSLSVQTYFINLFDSSFMRTIQLEVRSDRNTIVQKITPPDSDGNIRPWLYDRWNELIENYSSDSCDRSLYGKLTCTTVSWEDEFPTSEETDRVFELVAQLQQKWLESNGSTFTTGKIKLDFLPGKIIETEPNGYCVIDDGERSFVNAFKGPLFVVDNEARRSSALYAADGTHLREIPNVIVGDEYVWLSLAVGKNLIAISKSTYQAIPVVVAEWAEEIPSFAVPQFYSGETDEDGGDSLSEDAQPTPVAAWVKDIPVTRISHMALLIDAIDR